MANTPLDSLPANELISSVSGNVRYSAFADVVLTPGSGFVRQDNNAQLIQTATASGTAVQRIKLAADTNYRLGLSADGYIMGGSGSALEDRRIYPVSGSAKTWRVDDGAGGAATWDVLGALIGSVSVTTPLLNTSASDLNINASTGFVRFNSNNLTGIGTAIGVALDFTSLINTNVAGTTSLTIGAILGDLRLSSGSAGVIDFLDNTSNNVGNMTLSSGKILKTNTINETTAAAGVTVDGLLIKDSGLTIAGLSYITASGRIDVQSGGVINANAGGEIQVDGLLLTNSVYPRFAGNNLTLNPFGTGLLLIDSNYGVTSIDANVTAHAGGGQGSAYQITKAVTNITTVASAGDSLKQPASPANGQQTEVTNNGANPADIFPQSGSKYNTSGTDVAYSLAPGETLVCRYISSTNTWNKI